MCFQRRYVFKEEMSVKALKWTSDYNNDRWKKLQESLSGVQDEVVSLCMMKPNAHIIVYETSEIKDIINKVTLTSIKHANG